MIVERVDGTRTSELRRQVLRPGWAAGTPMHGDTDPAAAHLAAIDDRGDVVGAVVLLVRPYPRRPDEAGAWQLRGMAVAETLRGQGIGAVIVAAALEVIREQAGRLVWCEAREQAVAFYERHGFTAEGDRFRHAETGIPHFYMYLELRP